MDTIIAKQMAEQYMDYYGLHAWKFKWDRAVKRFGQCSFNTRTISLSKPLTEVNDVANVKDTILHEIAHALAGYDAGHGPKWQKIAVELGANPSSHNEGNDVPARYSLVCKNCGYSKSRYRRTSTKYACTRCCNRYNGGRYSDQFALTYIDHYEMVDV